MSAGGDDVIDAKTDGDEQCRHKEEGRQHEGEAGFLDAAHVDDRDDGENQEAERQLVRLQAGDRADQRRDTGGDADGRGEDVVDHQRGSGEQTGARSEVLAGDGVGTAAVGVGLDGLAIAEVENEQQREDRRENRQQVVLDADETERNQQGHGSFGAVSGAGKAVQAEDRDAGGYSNMCFMLGVGSERLSNY